MFAVIHLPQFALQAALRHASELWARPVALVDPALTTPRVCDASVPARAAGVMNGLTPTQALARCCEVLIRHRSPTQESAATHAALQCACGFSPNIESTAPDIVTLDLRGLIELKSGGERELFGWANRLRDALASLNLVAALGIGPTPNVAAHAAASVSFPLNHNLHLNRNLPAAAENKSKSRIKITSRSEEASAIPIRIVLDPPTFIAGLPIAALQPSTDVAILLEKWGLRTVGELLALGQDALTERLGLEAFALFAAASTTALRPLHLVRPAEEFEESFDFEQAIETAEPLLFVLNRFVGQLSRRLELTGLAAEMLTLRLRLESGAVLERCLRVPEPTRRAEVLLRMLQTHLETLRTDSPIASVGLKLDPVQPAQKQFSLFEAALRDPHQFQETLARLSALVGADRVGTPVRENSHRPDSFTLVPPDFENAPSSITARIPEISRVTPLRRLRPAVKAQVELSKLRTQSTKEAAKSRGANPEASELAPPRNIIDLLGPLFHAPSATGLRPVTESGLPLHESRSSRREEAPFSKSEIGNRRSEMDQSLLTSAATVQGVEARTGAASSNPITLRCKLADGRLRVALGPWRSSGRWWEPGGWQREEWDVETARGRALRLVHTDGEWRVEAIVD